MKSLRKWALAGCVTIAALCPACARHMAPNTSEGSGDANQPTASGNFPQAIHGEKSASMSRTAVRESHAASPTPEPDAQAAPAKK